MMYVIHDVITSPDGAQEFPRPVGQIYALPVDTVHTSNRFIGARPAYTVYFVLHLQVFNTLLYMTTSYNSISFQVLRISDR